MTVGASQTGFDDLGGSGFDRPTKRKLRMYHDQIREILTTHARLATAVAELANDGDLYEAGLTSLGPVNTI